MVPTAGLPINSVCDRISDNRAIPIFAALRNGAVVVPLRVVMIDTHGVAPVPHRFSHTDERPTPGKVGAISARPIA